MDTTFRLVPGFIIAWLIFLFQKNKLTLLTPLRNIKLLGIIILSSGLGTFMALSFWILGYANIQKPPIASIIGQTSTIFIAFFGWVILNESFSKKMMLSFLVAIIGAFIIILNP